MAIQNFSERARAGYRVGRLLVACYKIGMRTKIGIPFCLRP